MRDVCQKLQSPYELTEDPNLNKETQERQPAFHGLEDMLPRWQYFQVDLYDQCSPVKISPAWAEGMIRENTVQGRVYKRKKDKMGNQLHVL